MTQPAIVLDDEVLSVATRDGAMRLYRAGPRTEAPAPGVIMYMDAVGFRDELRGLARLVAGQGYECWLPDLYYRDGGPSFDPHSPQKDFEKFAPLMLKVTREAVISDSRALLARMDADARVARGPKACVGFCMGGRLALWAAGAFPEQFTAAASLHGGKLGTDAPDSPHRYAAAMRCEVYLGFASDDPLVPPEHIRAIETALTAARVPFLSEVHPATEHGYMFPERNCYQATAAETSWDRIFALFARRVSRQKRTTNTA